MKTSSRLDWTKDVWSSCIFFPNLCCSSIIWELSYVLLWWHLSKNILNNCWRIKKVKNWCIYGHIYQCVKTRTSAGDGIDNDCDGKIDEEKKNGKDDDNDGKIDEDLDVVNWFIHFFISEILKKEKKVEKKKKKKNK